jgi:hypothetical protein
VSSHKTAVCIIPANGDGPDLVLNMVVIDRQMPVVHKARERPPALEAVIDRSGRGRAIGNLLPVRNQPLVQ